MFCFSNVYIDIISPSGKLIKFAKTYSESLMTEFDNIRAKQFYLYRVPSVTENKVQILNLDIFTHFRHEHIVHTLY